MDPDAPVRFAVDLFDVAESNITPGSGAALEALGKAPPVAPGATGSPAIGSPVSDATPRPPARDELWGPILLLALALLCLEWAIYQRDALARFRRALAARLSAGRAIRRGD